MFLPWSKCTDKKLWIKIRQTGLLKKTIFPEAVIKSKRYFTLIIQLTNVVQKAYMRRNIAEGGKSMSKSEFKSNNKTNESCLLDSE